MKIENTAIAGTLESSDAQVTVGPSTDGLDLTIQSSVMNQYGRQIYRVAKETLDQLGVDQASVTIVDQGALDCTLKARLECAVYRSLGQSDQAIKWEVL
ncbi:citrate lyase ACP [Aerococcus urinaehominis]|uniref:Citrate lyase acyl carrier protein n=2 Tax=Aerococcus urinaehominis TaxID=128944 RepID=A0A0X8FJZ5_9LACT|nr:citrate lyase acyl carrier protein [Aerococcus urinaehominis]AMB98713.1 citrate lyase ACP [Aerococcus urinaehominis]SDL99748.1 citrate lyase subunit gamma (acyl carrier protein) [Aerococcus urinaehominis]